MDVGGDGQIAGRSIGGHGGAVRCRSASIELWEFRAKMVDPKVHGRRKGRRSGSSALFGAQLVAEGATAQVM